MQRPKRRSFNQPQAEPTQDAAATQPQSATAERTAVPFLGAEAIARVQASVGKNCFLFNAADLALEVAQQMTQEAAANPAQPNNPELKKSAGT